MEYTISSCVKTRRPSSTSTSCSLMTVFTYNLQQWMIVRLETPSFCRQQAAADTHSDGRKDPDIVATNSYVMEGATPTDPNADEG